MKEHALARCCGERVDGEGGMRQRISWHRWLLACMAVALTVCSPSPSEAVNGEPVGGQGLFRAQTCTSDFTISCDDRAVSGVVSCHMRGAKGSDEGLAINACIDGRITAATTVSQSLEANEPQINATDFGGIVCGKESGADFCIVCDTFIDPAPAPSDPAGASHCVKVVNDGQNSAPEDPTCGAFNVTIDNSAVCAAQTAELRQFFSNPQLGFSISFDSDDSSKQALGGVAGKDLLVCSGRSWQCIQDRTPSPAPLVSNAPLVQQQQLHGFVNSPCCMKLPSGSNYCSAKLTLAQCSN